MAKVSIPEMEATGHTPESTFAQIMLLAESATKSLSDGHRKNDLTDAIGTLLYMGQNFLKQAQSLQTLAEQGQDAVSCYGLIRMQADNLCVMYRIYANKNEAETTFRYLRSLGFDVNNTTFEKNSWYFRNALVRANYQNLQKGIYKETIHLELFFRNLLMGEDNVLMNRHLHIKAKELLDEATPASTPTSTPTSFIPESENIKRLISAIAEKQLSVKEMMAAVGLKDRPNFIEYSLSPAMREGYVRMLYPDSPRHPRQKYLLTVKGLAAYKELSR